MAQTGTEAIEREVRIRARPETIFPYLTDPAKIVKWHGVRATLDPRPGGIFEVEVIPMHTARGEFKEVEPPYRVVFTWGWQETESIAPGASTVEVTLRPDGNETILRLVHSGLPVEAAESHGRGWTHYLERLELAGAGGDPGPDPWAREDS